MMLRGLAVELDRILPDDALVLASVDFSHYVPEIVADFHDHTSLTTLLNFEFDDIYDLEVDSPASLSTITTFLKLRNAQSPLYLSHTNSASFSDHPEIEETTSHLYFAFGEGEPMEKMGMSVLMFGGFYFRSRCNRRKRKIWRRICSRKTQRN